MAVVRSTATGSRRPVTTCPAWACWTGGTARSAAGRGTDDRAKSPPAIHARGGDEHGALFRGGDGTARRMKWSSLMDEREGCVHSSVLTTDPAVDVLPSRPQDIDESVADADDRLD